MARYIVAQPMRAAASRANPQCAAKADGAYNERRHVGCVERECGGRIGDRLCNPS
jgi:hypothetical protein